MFTFSKIKPQYWLQTALNYRCHHYTTKLCILSLDFEYVVTQKPPPRICFGSALERHVLPVKGPGLSPFMRRQTTEVRDNVGPGSYEDRRNCFYDATHKVRLF